MVVAIAVALEAIISKTPNNNVFITDISIATPATPNAAKAVNPVAKAIRPRPRSNMPPPRRANAFDKFNIAGVNFFNNLPAAPSIANIAVIAKRLCITSPTVIPPIILSAIAITTRAADIANMAEETSANLPAL